MADDVSDTPSSPLVSRTSDRNDNRATILFQLLATGSVGEAQATADGEERFTSHMLTISAESQYRSAISTHRDVEFSVLATICWDDKERRHIEIRELAARGWLDCEGDHAWSTLLRLHHAETNAAEWTAASGDVMLQESVARGTVMDGFYKAFKGFSSLEIVSFLIARRAEVASMEGDGTPDDTSADEGATPTWDAESPAKIEPKPPKGRRATAAPPRRVSLSSVGEPTTPAAARSTDLKQASVHVSPSHLKTTLDVFQMLEPAELKCRHAVADAYGAVVGGFHDVRALMDQRSGWSLLVSAGCEEHARRRYLQGTFVAMLLEACQVLETLERRDIDTRQLKVDAIPLATAENASWLTSRQREVSRGEAHLKTLRQREVEERNALIERLQVMLAQRGDAEAAELRARFDVEHTEMSFRAVLRSQEDQARWPLLVQQDRRKAEFDRSLVTLTWDEASYSECYLAELRGRQAVIVDEQAARTLLNAKESHCYLQTCRDVALNDAVRRRLHVFDDEAGRPKPQ